MSISHIAFIANMVQLEWGVSSWCNGKKAIDCGIVVSEFELQSRYYVHFRPNTLGKSKKLLLFPAMA